MTNIRFLSLAATLFLAAVGLTNCQNQAAQPAKPAPATDNQLSDAEQKEGWKLLFDGKSYAGWHKYGGVPVGKMWVIQDGSIHLDAKKQAGHWQASDGGDIVSDGEFENFELRLEWKIDSCGNSGIIYHVVEDTANYDYPWMTGPEMQVLDNACHADSKITKHRAGDLYDLVECSQVTVKPHGQWNAVRLVSQNGKVEHWLNGTKVVEIQMFESGKPTQHWLDLIKGSKFPGLPAPAFGLSAKGKVCLQDHGDRVWYKNVKIKQL